MTSVQRLRRARALRRVDGQLHTDDRLHATYATGLGEAHGPAEVGVIGEGQTRLPQFMHAIDQRFGRRRAIEQGEARMTVQLDVVSHTSRAGTRLPHP